MQAEDAEKAQQQHGGPSTGSVLLSFMERELWTFSMVCGKSCASFGKMRKDVGELVSSLASAETLPLLPLFPLLPAVILGAPPLPGR